MMAHAVQGPAIPAVVRIEVGEVRWWAPIRSGDDAEDYAAGAVAFRDAQAMAHHGLAFGLICSFILAMREVQAYELGFLDALAAACIACPDPCLYEESHIAEQVAAGCGAIEAEACRLGNREAWEDRRAGCAERIVRELIRFIWLDSGPSGPAYVHSLSVAVCRSGLAAN